MSGLLGGGLFAIIIITGDGSSVAVRAPCSLLHGAGSGRPGLVFTVLYADRSFIRPAAGSTVPRDVACYQYADAKGVSLPVLV